MAKPKSSKSSSSTSTPTKHPSTSSSSNNNNSNTAAGEYLLERLRILLNRLQSTTEILQNWPETKGDSAKRHFDTSTELIASIRKIVLGLRAVERHVNGTGPSNNPTTATSGGSGAGGEGTTTNAALASISKEALEAFRTSLEQKCPIPLDLLDLLDVPALKTNPVFGMNPQCYARGLMKESMRQLAGLERRKRALAMLAQSIEEGMTLESGGDRGSEASGAEKKIENDKHIEDASKGGVEKDGMQNTSTADATNESTQGRSLNTNTKRKLAMLMDHQSGRDEAEKKIKKDDQIQEEAGGKGESSERDAVQKNSTVVDAESERSGDTSLNTKRKREDMDEGGSAETESVKKIQRMD